MSHITLREWFKLVPGLLIRFFFFVLPKSLPVVFWSSRTERNAQCFERLGENQDFRMFRDSDRRQQQKQKSNERDPETPLAKPAKQRNSKTPKTWCPEWQGSQGWHPWHRGSAGTCWQGVGRHLQAVNQPYLFSRICLKNFLSQLCQLARDNYLLQQVKTFLKFACDSGDSFAVISRSIFDLTNIMIDHWVHIFH